MAKEFSAPADRQKRRVFRRKRWRFAGLILIAIFVAFGVSFIVFANRVTELAEPAKPSADAIVALTGGAERIDKALMLLADKRAKRLLISGVHPDTTQETLQKRTGHSGELFRCCVDIEHKALNTIGNARETQKWVDLNGFKSLIVVTSAYHMPRSLAELRAAMPGMRLTGYPILPESVTLNNWWSRSTTTRLLLSEYLKYVIASVRLSVRASFAKDGSAKIAGSASN